MVVDDTLLYLLLQQWSFEHFLFNDAILNNYLLMLVVLIIY